MAAEARAFLARRGDRALGAAPQALLDGDGPDAWACLWAACRRIDDAIDVDGTEPPVDWRHLVGGLPAARRELDAYAALMPAHARTVMARADAAWAAVRARHAWNEPPPLAEYAQAGRRAAGLPMAAFFLMAGLGEADAVDVGGLVGLSIQVGDDARDSEEDAASGLVTTVAEEATSADPRWRERVASWVLAEALARLPRLSPQDAPRVLGPFVLWHGAIRTGQVAPTRRPLVLAGPDASRRGIQRAYARVFRDAAASPEAVIGALRQDLRHRAQRLHLWESSVLEAALPRVVTAGR